ncbi:MAG: hypothetical protein HOV79_28995 [Hamadaea sp.]|nr:hypothetical protein [Hamadaea sp.]
MTRTVVFVCEHGALRSRLAAAFFNAVAPVGWRATAAGLDPQDAVSSHAARLAEGTDAAALLDTSAPVAFAGSAAADLVVAIDCDASGADRWTLDATEVDERMRDELRDRARELARSVGR